MLSEEDGGMDYDELTLNPLLVEIEAETDLDSKKEKQRRYWSAKEEQHFFEIWGRDNWRLTRHGKNTIFFAQWANELKERFDIEVKPEEIQAKVNQTRAKFRQVKKQIAADKNAARWKKFGIIDKILKNQYRPKDAEPVPKEALENNRDIDLSEVGSPPSPPRSARQSSPTSITSSSNTQEATNNASTTENNNGSMLLDVPASSEDIDIKSESEFLADSSITTSLFNTSTELFSDTIEEIKTEFTSEFPSFGNYPQPNHIDAQPPTQDYDDEEPQLHTLQTPQQLLEQQQQQQQTIQASSNHLVEQSTPQQQVLKIQQPQQQQQPPDVILNLNANALSTLQNLGNGNPMLADDTRLSSQQQQQRQTPLQPAQLKLKLQQQQQQHQPSQLPAPPDTHALVAISSSHSSASSSPSIYIKDEPDSPDTLSLTTVTINEHNSSYSPRRNASPTMAAVKYKHNSNLNSLPKPIAMHLSNTNNNNNSNGVFKSQTKTHLPPSSASLVIDEDFAEPDLELDDLDDPDVDMLDDGRLSAASTYTMGMLTKPSQPSAREILYTKFGDFLAARLNTLNETVANDLMNRILLLIAEK
uniref:Myb/SANT-like DNA-binding domain-containing protein n=1 Tax=Ceratitis capitata TaxID=7213 RepID=W8B7Z1_CERCA